MNRVGICTILIAGLAPRLVVADDTKDLSDTVASTWSGGVFRLSTEDKRFTLATSSLFAPGIRVRAEASAPLDDETRTAVFVAKHGLAPGFRAGLSIGYDSTYSALALKPGENLKTLCGAKMECTGSDRALPGSVADRMVNGQPLSDDLTWHVGLDLAFAYDRKTAFLDDVGNSNGTREFSSSDLQIGASGFLHPHPNWVLTARAGYERANTPKLGTFRRCTTLATSDPMVSGQDCSDQRYLLSNPGPENSAYTRLSVAYQPPSGLLAQYLSAAELRLNLEGLMTEAGSFDVHALVFAKAREIGGTKVRPGFGTTVRTALRSPSGVDYGRGDIYDYSLFGILGASFD